MRRGPHPRIWWLLEGQSERPCIQAEVRFVRCNDVRDAMVSFSSSRILVSSKGARSHPGLIYYSNEYEWVFLCLSGYPTSCTFSKNDHMSKQLFYKEFFDRWDAKAKRSSIFRVLCTFEWCLLCLRWQGPRRPYTNISAGEEEEEKERKSRCDFRIFVIIVPNWESMHRKCVSNVS